MTKTPRSYHEHVSVGRDDDTVVKLALLDQLEEMNSHLETIADAVNTE